MSIDWFGRRSDILSFVLLCLDLLSSAQTPFYSQVVGYGYGYSRRVSVSGPDRAACHCGWMRCDGMIESMTAPGPLDLEQYEEEERTVRK